MPKSKNGYKICTMNDIKARVATSAGYLSACEQKNKNCYVERCASRAKDERMLYLNREAGLLLLVSA